MTEELSGPPALLHNMSVAPRTTISHQGAGMAGRGVLFSLATIGHGAVTKPTARVLLKWLGLDEKSRSAVARLQLLLNDCARSLPYPAACPVVREAKLASETCTDLLVVMTVLAKSSGHVYLRDKEPSLSAITADRTVVLIVPKSWRPPSC